MKVGGEGGEGNGRWLGRCYCCCSSHGCVRLLLELGCRGRIGVLGVRGCDGYSLARKSICYKSGIVQILKDSDGRYIWKSVIDRSKTWMRRKQKDKERSLESE